MLRRLPAPRRRPPPRVRTEDRETTSGCGSSDRDRSIAAPFVVSSLMGPPTLTPQCAHWRPEFDRLLQTVRGCGTHGQLVDVRETLRHAIGPSRPLVMLCPHADDGAITAACLLHEYAVRRGLARHRGPGLRRRAERGRALAQRPEEGLGPRVRVPPRMQRARGRGRLLGPRRLPDARLSPVAGATSTRSSTGSPTDGPER